MLAKQGKPRGVVELSYKVFNFTEDQDLKLKIGYNAFKQVGALIRAHSSVFCQKHSEYLVLISSLLLALEWKF